METLIKKSARQVGLLAFRLNQTHKQMNEQFETIIDSFINGQAKQGSRQFCELGANDQQDFLYYLREQRLDSTIKSNIYIKLLINVTAGSGKC